MNFNWNSFSDVAYHLYDYSNEENYLRSSVGRFYYAAFGSTKEYYERTHNKIIPSINAHKLLIKFLLDSVYDDENQLGEFLVQLRTFRVNADYHNKFIEEYASKSKIAYINLEKTLNSLNKNPVVLKF